MNLRVASRNKLHPTITGSLVFVPLEVVSCLSVLTKIPTSGMVIPPMLISQVKYFYNGILFSPAPLRLKRLWASATPGCVSAIRGLICSLK